MTATARIFLTSTVVLTLVLLASFLQRREDPSALAGTVALPSSESVQVMQGDCSTFKQTGHSVCGRFLQYWQNNGGLPQFGYPISDPFTERSDLNQQLYTVQYFERAVFELHPENKPPYDVLLSQLGTLWFKSKYPNGVVSPSATPATPGVDPQPQPLQPGVTVSLIPQEQASTTGVHTGSCGPDMTWVLRIYNGGNAPFLASIDTAGVTMVDSSGQQYPLSACGPFSGSFAEPATVPVGGVHTGTIEFQAPAQSGARYYELHVRISNTPVTFRWNLAH